MSGVLKLAVVSAALAAALVTTVESRKAAPTRKSDRAPVAAPAPDIRTGAAQPADMRPVRLITIVRRAASLRPASPASNRV